jgi:hypothetical protein
MGTGPPGARAGDYAGFDEAVRNFECNGGSLGTAVILNAFDLVELDGQDWRPRRLEERKERLERLLVKAPGRGALHGASRGRRAGEARYIPVCRTAATDRLPPDEKRFRFWPISDWPVVCQRVSFLRHCGHTLAHTPGANNANKSLLRSHFRVLHES